MIEGFIHEQRAWIENQLANTPEAIGLYEWLRMHPRIAASGESLELRIKTTPRKRSHYFFDRDGLELVFCLPEITETPLRRLVRVFARDTLTCRTYYHAKRLGLSPGRLSVRDQSSRWGSCSSSRSLSLNWRLVLIAPELQDYVILHELAHISEMNHSHRFWELLDRYDPHRVDHEAELDRVSAEIMRVGRG